MGKRLRFLLFFLMLFTGLYAQEKPVYTLFLIGDAGEPSVITSPVGPVLRNLAANTGVPTKVLYLGDNIYPRGMASQGSRSRSEAEAILTAQASWVKGLEAEGIIIPGNHDWQQGKRKGFQYIVNQRQFVDSLKQPNLSFLPVDGCPGPVEVPLGDDGVLVILDTQWFLHPWEKPEAESGCEGKTTQEVLVLLADVFNRNRNKRVIVAAHHPLITYGEHGGVFRLKDHIFPLTQVADNFYLPLPVIGSIYPVYRSVFGNIQDTKHPTYKAFATGISEIMAEYPGSIYVAGHEHAFEYIVRDSTYFIVSGSGSKSTYVKQKKYSQFAASVKGFVQLSAYANGTVRIDYWEADEKFPQGKIVFSDTLRAPARISKAASTALPDFTTKVVRVHASSQYVAGGLKKRMFGKNYREEWAQEVEVPLFDIGTEQGGLKILQRGGGQQTLSLRLEDANGREFVLRSVEKDPVKVVPEMLRKTFAQDLVQDQISASHPYAALVVAEMADAVGIYHTNPRLVYIPDDPRLGEYRHDFRNMLALFEERPAGDWSDKPYFGNSKKIINTTKVLEKLQKDNQNHVDQKFVLRSRLFDLVIGDWDRHDDQWRWASFEDKKEETYQPIPRDRDQTFFLNEGRIAKLWSRRWTLPKFEGFDEDIDWPSGLSFNARFFDRSFLTELTLEEWIKVADEVQKSLTDDVIEKAIRKWPPEIFNLHGEEIIRNIKARRNRLVEYAADHYKFLAREVDIAGSDKAELFEIEREENGNVKIQGFNIPKDGGKGRKFYERQFRFPETKEVRIYALGGDDIITLKGEGARGVRVRVIGGDGKDKIARDGGDRSIGHKTLFYDLKDGGTIDPSSGVRDKTSDDPAVNEYNRKAFKYNRLAPLVYGNFNPDDGVFIGGGMFYQTEGFRKTPFKQRHVVLASVAPATNSYNLTYRGDFTELFGKWGVEINGDLKSPNYVNNFFGMGNESVYDDHIEDKPGINVDESFHYYRFRFEELRLEAFIGRKIGNWGSFKIGPALQRIEVEEPDGDEDRYITEYAATLPYDLFTEYNNYTGVAYNFTIDRRNSPAFTTRGVVLNLDGRNMAGTDARASSFGSYEGSLSFYQSFRLPARVVFAARVGGGFNTGNYEFYQAQILSGRTSLRGFRKTRFYGDSKFYSNFEMRIKLFSIRTYLFPASVGVLGFHDLGRVWYKDDNGVDPSAADGKSNKWHKGFGGGIWFTPFNLSVLSVEAGHSEEGTLGYVRLGFLF